MSSNFCVKFATQIQFLVATKIIWSRANCDAGLTISDTDICVCVRVRTNVYRRV